MTSGIEWGVEAGYERVPKQKPVGRPPGGLRVVGLFAGIGGIELGLHQAGHGTEMLCEIDPAAVAVLREHFPGIPIEPDVREIRHLPTCDLVAAGFPCQDLSQAGRTAGISGTNSSLIGYVFDLLEKRSRRGPRWLLIENVPFMLQLNGGRAMRYLTRRLGELGFRWAYRTVETRSFGLPQRRQRVFLLASRTDDPRSALFNDDVAPPPPVERSGVACGFYWTEGIRGLGWAIDAVPTLKGGSTIGIPSPPGIWMPDGMMAVPEIRDAERLQGFPSDWTLVAAQRTGRKGPRWKLVGNSVTVPVARWIGERLRVPGRYEPREGDLIVPGGAWPAAAWGENGAAYRASVSMWPTATPQPHLAEFLAFPTIPLSERATSGFLERTRVSRLRFPPGFLEAVAEHLKRMRSAKAVA